MLNENFTETLTEEVKNQWCQGRKVKRTASGWLSGNAICCSYNGESPDKRGRAGLRPTDSGWVYSCFNCNFKASFTFGKPLSIKAKKLLSWLGFSDDRIGQIGLAAFRAKVAADGGPATRPELPKVSFKEIALPSSATPVTPKNAKEWDYIRQRQVPESFQIYIDPVTFSTRPHVLIPFTHNNIPIGYTVRMLDGSMPKYLTQMPNSSGYVFGIDQQKSNHSIVIVTEGIFDALAIGGVAFLHSAIHIDQCRAIAALGKHIIFVPDRDSIGLKLVEQAMEFGWNISIPKNWANDIKDVNDAVCRYGKTATLLSIIESSTKSPIKIKLAVNYGMKNLQAK